MKTTPGIDRSVPSAMCSPWWRVCASLGYPELDVRQYEDGEYALIQYMTAPVIPSLTKWQLVLGGIRNVEMSASFIKAQADKLNLERRHVWDDLDKRDGEILDEIKGEESRSQDFASRMMKAIKRSPALTERIYRNGLKELDPRRQVQHIDIRHLGKEAKDIKRV